MIYASKAEATCPWAFTMDEVMLGCEGGKDDALPILMTEDGTLYGFTGLAASRLKLPGVRDIWAADPKLPGQKVGIGPWLDAARAMCR